MPCSWSTAYVVTGFAQKYPNGPMFNPAEPAFEAFRQHVASDWHKVEDFMLLKRPRG